MGSWYEVCCVFLVAGPCKVVVVFVVEGGAEGEVGGGQSVIESIIVLGKR